MNRAARRAAAARARRGRRAGYMHRLLGAMGSGALKPTPGVHIANIEHDSGCSIYRGGGCDCVPEISVSGPDGVTTIDERGVGTKRARQ